MADEKSTIMPKNLMQYFIPTSAAARYQSLERLLKHFCASSITIKSASLQNGRCINYVDISGIRKSSPNRTEEVLVLAHGFGLGLGFFFNNFDRFANDFDRIIAFDWSGMGGSTRSEGTAHSDFLPPKRQILRVFASQISSAINHVLPFPSKVKSYNEEHPSQATNFFIDDLEEFRKLTLPADSRFVLAGHSLGGFLCARYSIKYPHNVKALVLMSPVGLPKHPSTQILPKQMTSGQIALNSLWALNFTPQGILRAVGPRGPKMLNSIIDRRFGRRWAETERDLLGSYLYHITAAPPLGEYAMNSLLSPIVYMARKELSAGTVSNQISKEQKWRGDDAQIPSSTAEYSFRTGIYAREPLYDRLVKLRDHGIPLLILFGDDDWMAYKGLDADAAYWTAQVI